MGEQFSSGWHCLATCHSREALGHASTRTSSSSSSSTALCLSPPPPPPLPPAAACGQSRTGQRRAWRGRPQPPPPPAQRAAAVRLVHASWSWLPGRRRLCSSCCHATLCSGQPQQQGQNRAVSVAVIPCPIPHLLLLLLHRRGGLPYTPNQSNHQLNELNNAPPPPPLPQVRGPSVHTPPIKPTN